MQRLIRLVLYKNVASEAGAAAGSTYRVTIRSNTKNDTEKQFNVAALVVGKRGVGAWLAQLHGGPAAQAAPAMRVQQPHTHAPAHAA